MSINEIARVYDRPWGTYKTIDQQKGFQVKTITVMPGGRLSLQSHKKRAEHWIVAQGAATVTVNEETHLYQVNEHIFIPIKAKHRLENLTESNVIIIEVQIGSYLGEDDITRFDDIYGRD